MGISGISGAIKIASLVGRVLSPGGSSAEAESNQQTEAAGGGRPSPAGPSSHIAQLLPADGLRAIEPRQLADLAQQLHEQGLIGESEFNDLAAVRLQLELAGVDFDKPVDLLAFVQERLAGLEKQYASSDVSETASISQSLDTARRQLGLVQQLDAARQGVNIAA